MPTLTSEQRSGASQRASIEAKHQKPEAAGLAPKDRRAAIIGARLDQPRAAWQELQGGSKINKPDVNLAVRNVVGTLNERGEREVDPKIKEAVDKYNPRHQAYIERGFDGLSQQQQKDMINEIRLVVEGTTEGRAMSDELEGHIIDHLRNPDFQARFGSQYNDLIESIRDSVNVVPEARRNLTNTQEKALKAEVELRINSESQKIVQNELAEYEDRSLQTDEQGVAGKMGDKFKELRDLEGELPDLQSSLPSLNASLNQALRDHSRIEALYLAGADFMNIPGGRVEINQALEQAGQKVSALQTEVNQINNKINRRDELVARKSELLTKNGELSIKQAELESQQRNAKEDLSQAQVNYQLARERRSIEENAFVDNLGQLAANTAREYFIARAKRSDELQDQIDQEEASKFENTADIAAQKGLKKNYERGKPRELIAKTWFGRRLVNKGLVQGSYNEGLIREDLNNLMKNGNPNLLVEKALKTAVDEKGNRLMTDEEVAQKMLDEAFVEKWSIQAVARLLKARAKIGGPKLTEAEAQIIAESDWTAKALALAVEDPNTLERIEADPVNKTELDKLKAKHGTDDLKELLTKTTGKSLLVLLLMIFGSVVFQGIKQVNISTRNG